MEPQDETRRDFLRHTLTGTVLATTTSAAAAGEPAPDVPPAPAPRYADYLAERDRAGETIPPTEDNIEGPFYRPGVPFRTRLHNPGEPGDLIIVSGTVVARNGRPIAGAVLDIWHANHMGQYDNGDPEHPPAANEYHLRGRLRTDEQGRFTFESIRPGHYRITPLEFRAAHIHFKVSAEGYQPLVSQFFFAGEPHNQADPWFKPSMVLQLQFDGERRYRANFRIVLARA